MNNRIKVNECWPTASERADRRDNPSTYDPARDRDALTAIGAPKVPGIYAGVLQPSIGTDHYRLSAGQKTKGQLKHRAIPISGSGSMAKVFARKGGKKADPKRFAPIKPKSHRERSKAGAIVQPL